MTVPGDRAQLESASPVAEHSFQLSFLILFMRRARTGGQTGHLPS
jgi:hypothetical protein